MSYLITQIIVCLLFAFLIGLLVGWLFRNHGLSARLQTQDTRWRQRTRTLEGERDRAQALSDELNVRVNNLGAELSAAAESAEQLSQKFRRCEETVAARETTIGGLEQRIVALENVVEEEKTSLDEWKSKLTPLQQRVEGRDREIAGLQAQLQTKSEALSELLSEAEEHRQTVASLRSEAEDRGELEKLLAEREQHIASRDERIRRLEIGLRECRESAQQAAGPAPSQQQESTGPSFRIKAGPGEKDDLKKIHGIGPVLEGMLNGLGICLFSQIAAFTSDDIHWVTDHIDAFPDRIVRDKWVEQAAEFAAQKT